MDRDKLLFLMVQISLLVAAIGCAALLWSGNKDVRADAWYLPVILVLLWTSEVYKRNLN